MKLQIQALLMRLLILLFTLFLFSPGVSFSSDFKEGFYKLDKSRIEIRCLIKGNTSASIERTSLDGKTYNLCNSTLIETSDFEGITLTNNNLQFYLKKESWGKSRNITKKYLNQQLAIIIANKVVATPVVREAISKSFIVSGTEKFSHLLKLLPFEKPKYLENRSGYIDFLADYINENPEDLNAVQELAYLHISEEDYSVSEKSLSEQNCNKAIPLYEILITKKPAEVDNYMSLFQCFINNGEYEQAISILYKALPYQQESYKWVMYSEIATAQLMKSEFDKALKTLNKAKDGLDNFSMIPPGFDKNTSIEFVKPFFQGTIEPDVLANLKSLDEIDNYLKNESYNRLNTLIHRAENKEKIK
ncbi:MAG: hypothetical protein GY707_16315 [Desulfobacteraceae bacterium]|nr:hypothetical protein [Desulfobacteraceae bacterium]